MQVKLTQTKPKHSGYYLMKCSPASTLHFVLLILESQKPKIFNGDGRELYFNEFPDFWWSEPIVSVI